MTDEPTPEEWKRRHAEAVKRVIEMFPFERVTVPGD